MANSGNMFVRNQGLNPAVNFNFMLRVEGLIDVPCRAVRAFQRENEYEIIQEGGLNDYVHMRRKPISKPFTFQVERYVGVDVTDPLANGTELILPVILYVNRNTVYGKDPTEIGEFAPVRMYVFTGCTVMSKEYGGLDAEKSGLLLETTTIAYREMVCMENVISFQQDAGDLWQFNGTDRVGNGKRSSRSTVYEDNEVRLTEMSEKAVDNCWSFDKETGDYRGTGPRHAASKVNNKKIVEVRLPQMAENAKKHLWEFDQRWGMKGNDQRSAKVTESELRRIDMDEIGRKWEFGQDAKGTVGMNGTGTRSAVHPPQEARKTALEREAKRNLWQFDTKTGDVKGLGRQSAVRREGELPKRRMEMLGQRWPETRSAVDVGDFLTDTEQNAPRNWDFDGTGYQGKGDRSAMHPETELRREAMEKLGQRWPEKESAKHPENELRKEAMEKLGQRWPEKESAKHPKNELRKGTMKDLGRRWPETRSAVDVADFLARESRRRNREES